MSRLPRPIRGLLFDKDGTLIDYAASWPPINREAALLAAAGDDALAARLLAIGGADAAGMAQPDTALAAGSAADIARLWCTAGSAFAEPDLADRLDALFAASVPRMVAVCDLAALFQRLAGAGFALGVASSDCETAVVETARHFGFAARLAFACGHDSGHGAKPEAGMALAFCAATGLAPAEIAIIGDNSHDMEMGRAAGAGLRIAVLTGTGTRATLEPLSDLCLASITELEAALSIR